MKKPISAFIAILIPFFSWAQAVRPVIAVLPFATTGVGADEAKTIENLVQSYVSELDEWRFIAQNDRDLVLTEWEFSATTGEDIDSHPREIGKLLSADFLLMGSVGSIDANRVLTLDVVNVRTGEKKSVSLIRPTMSDLALGARDLVHQAIGRESLEESPKMNEIATPLSESAIAGTWKGDKGIELVRIFRGGMATAIFSSGIQMDLSYSIENDSLRIVQVSQNAERFYHPLPYKIAVQLVSLADPMAWTFKLYGNGSSLRGIKSATAVTYDNDKILKLEHNATREAEWIRLSR